MLPDDDDAPCSLTNNDEDAPRSLTTKTHHNNAPPRQRAQQNGIVKRGGGGEAIARGSTVETVGGVKQGDIKRGRAIKQDRVVNRGTRGSGSAATAAAWEQHGTGLAAAWQAKKKEAAAQRRRQLSGGGGGGSGGSSAAISSRANPNYFFCFFLSFSQRGRPFFCWVQTASVPTYRTQ